MIDRPSSPRATRSPQQLAEDETLREQGKIRHVGLSNVSVAEIEQARGIVEVVSVQNRCNPFDRAAFSGGVVRCCQEHGIAFLPHSPVGGHFSHQRVARDPDLGRVAARHGVSPYQVCLAWLLALSPVMIVIPGASKVDSATSSAAAGALQLAPDEVSALSEAFGVRV